jgi:hypothetical protein
MHDLITFPVDGWHKFMEYFHHLSAILQQANMERLCIKAYTAIGIRHADYVASSNRKSWH